MDQVPRQVSLSHLVEAFTKGLATLRGAIDQLKSATDQLPSGDQKTAIEKQIVEIERAIQLGNAELGQSLGFQLCNCSFPPQVMVSQGGVEEAHLESFMCPNCKKRISVQAPHRVGDKVTAFDPYDVY